MQMTYLEAVRRGIWEEMERDPNVFLLGEDIGIYGGAFKVTAGMLDHFGERRVIDTPISESAMVGAAIGAALFGQRPIVEISFGEFIPAAMSLAIISSESEAGPIVQTIFVRRITSNPSGNSAVRAWLSIRAHRNESAELPQPRQSPL